MSVGPKAIGHGVARPVGVWIVVAYLLVVLALGVVLLSTAMQGGNIPGTLKITAVMLIVISSAILLLARNRWAVPAIGLLAALQAGSYLAYLNAEGTLFVNLRGSDTVVHVFAITYNFAPLVLLGATCTALLYTVWLWRSGILR